MSEGTISSSIDLAQTMIIASKLPQRYGIGKTYFYQRRSYLKSLGYDLEPEKDGSRRKYTDPQVKLLDELDNYISSNGGMEGFPPANDSSTPHPEPQPANDSSATNPEPKPAQETDNEIIVTKLGELRRELGNFLKLFLTLQVALAAGLAWLVIGEGWLVR